jgi:hypothetical protein
LTRVSGGAGAGDLFLHKATKDDISSLVDCLKPVSCTKVSALVIYYYLFVFFR